MLRYEGFLHCQRECIHKDMLIITSLIVMKQEGDNDLGVAADLGAEKEVPHNFSGGHDL